MSVQLVLIVLPPSTSSAAAFPAKTSLSLAKALALRVSDPAFGSSTRESFANYDPVSSSWKTLQRSLLGDWTSFSGTWPRSGTMRSGIVSPLPPLAPLTSETDCSLWPTPTARDWKDGANPSLKAPTNGQLGKAAPRDPTTTGGGRTQSGLGRAVTRLPARVDRWPAGQGEAQHAWEAPRTIGRCDNRAARLKALGNAVVPQVAEVIGRTVMRIARNLETA